MDLYVKEGIAMGDFSREYLELLAEKYSPQVEDRAKEIDQQFAHVCMVEIAIDHMTGKEAIELVRERKAKGE